MKRLFLDTNVLVDLVCNREPFVDEAKRIFALAYANKVCVGISALSYINTVYISRKYNFCDDEVIDSLRKIASFTVIQRILKVRIYQYILQLNSCKYLIGWMNRVVLC